MRLAALILSAALLAPAVAACEEESVSPVTDTLVKSECGECHMVFQPEFLPAASWQKIMQTLDDHFGEDASLDVETRDKVEAYLIANAGRGRGDRANPPLRITELKWFRDEHSEREVRRLRDNRNVKTLSNCTACHRDADRGYFDDD